MSSILNNFIDLRDSKFAGYWWDTKKNYVYTGSLALLSKSPLQHIKLDFYQYNTTSDTFLKILSEIIESPIQIGYIKEPINLTYNKDTFTFNISFICNTFNLFSVDIKHFSDSTYISNVTLFDAPVIIATTPSITPTNTTTRTVTPTRTSSPTPTPTATVTNTPSITKTITRSVTPTRTPPPSLSVTPTPTLTPTLTPTNTPTVTPSETLTPTPTLTPSETVTPTPTLTPSETVTPTPTLTPTITDTPTQTPTNTVTPTITPTVTVTPTRPFEVITIAGSAGVTGDTDNIGTLARFFTPERITIDNTSSVLYITDSTRNVVRELNLNTQAVTTRIGTPGTTTLLNNPIGIAFATFTIAGVGVDMLFIADRLNFKIKRFILSTNTLEDHSGSGASGSTAGGTRCDTAQYADLYSITSRSGARAIDIIEGFLPDNTGNHTIRTAPMSSTSCLVNNRIGYINRPASPRNVWGDAVGTIASDNIRYLQPRDMVWSGTGSTVNAFIADWGNNKIKEYNSSVSTNPLSTVAGDGTGLTTDGIGAAAQFDGPIALARDTMRPYLYIAESRGHCIRRMNINTKEVITLAGQPGIVGSADGIRGNALFNTPNGIVLDSTNTYLYVCDSGNSTIRRITLP